MGKPVNYFNLLYNLSVFFQRENISEFSDSAEAEAGEDDNIAAVKDDPFLGPPDASVVVVEFSDYLCPGCRKAHDISKTIKEKYGDQICGVFKDFPLKQHKGSDKMAEAAHCADDQGKFWQYQDLMFSSEGPVDLQQLEKYAEDLDLGTDKFRHCMETQKHRRKVAKNIKNGKEAGVSVTPTFIINGQKISGTLTVERFEERIEAALHNVSSIKTEDGETPQKPHDQCRLFCGRPPS
jgi:protein-disulfide isomerase